MRYDSANGRHKEEYRAQHRESQSQFNDERCGDILLHTVRYQRLDPEVDGAGTETSERPDKMHNANIRLLEICNYADPQAGAHSKPETHVVPFGNRQQ